MTSKSGQTRRQKMRELRHEDFKERITQHGVLTHLVNSIDEIGELDVGSDTYTEELMQIKAQNEVRYKLLERCVPALKAVDIDMSGEMRMLVFDYTGVDGPPDEPEGDDTEP